MFDIGFQELLLCALIALIVLGPKRLPEAARAAGRWVGQVRRFISSVQRDLQDELRSEDLREFRRLKDELDEARQALNQASGDLGRTLNERISADEPAATPSPSDTTGAAGEGGPAAVLPPAPAASPEPEAVPPPASPEPAPAASVEPGTAPAAKG